MDVVVVEPEVTCTGLSMRSDDMGGRGEAQQVSVEFVVMEVGGCER